MLVQGDPGDGKTTLLLAVSTLVSKENNDIKGQSSMD
jgi:predicted ATP-dependent serine protease